MKEAALRRKIMKKLQETEGGFWFHPHGNMYTAAGIPDIIGCLRGCYIAFEVKRPDGGDATAKQQWTLDRITTEGGISAVIRSFEDAKEILDTHRDAINAAGDVLRDSTYG
jgi:hypothetical protein